ncbi:ankyrin protein [Apiospora sp. TS-2023a]
MPRVRGIPGHVDSIELQGRLEKFIPEHNVQVFSLAKALHQGQQESIQNATVAFQGPPCVNLNDIFSPDAKFAEVGPQEWMIPKDAMGVNWDITIDSHFFGYTVLYNPKDNQLHFTDYIAVTGLGGRALASWMPPNDTQFMWLRDYLPQSHVVDSQSEQLPKDLGRSMAQSLKASDSIRPASSKLVFIGHSLGGIVLKHALTHMAKEEETYRSILRSVEKIMLFGVPTRGMHIDHLLAMVQDNEQPNEHLIQQLGPKSEVLSKIDNEFSRICDGRQIRVISVYEQQRTRVSKREDGKWVRGAGEARMLVPKESAIHDLSSEADCLPINRDHSAIAKLPKHSGDLERVVGFLEPTEDKYNASPRGEWSFSGRQRELELIQRYFGQRPIQHHVTHVMLIGVSGMGKTLLAHEYAKRNRNRYTDVITINSESEARFVSSATTELQRLGTAMETYDFQSVSESLAGHLNDTSNMYLVIVDDIHSLRNRSESWTAIDEWLGRIRKGHVLITTHGNPDISGLPFDEIEVQPLSLAESKTLFEEHRHFKDEVKKQVMRKQRVVTDVSPQEHNEAFIESLNGHPMALACLATFYHRHQTQPSEYKSRLQGYKPTTAGPLRTTWDTRVDEVLNGLWTMYYKELCTNSVGIDILRFWTLLHPRDFSFKILEWSALSGFSDTRDPHAIPGFGMIAFTEYMETLIQLHLVDWNPIQESYTMHDLPFSWFRKRLRTYDQRWAVAATLGHAVSDRDSDTNYWLWGQRLLTHAKELWTLTPEPEGNTSEYQDVAPLVAQSQAEGLLDLASLLRSHARYTMAQDVLGHIEALVTKHSQEWEPCDIFLSQFYDGQGNLYKHLGLHKEALEKFEKAYDGLCMMNSNNDTSHRYEWRLDLLSNLSSQYEKVGLVEKALEGYKKLLREHGGQINANMRLSVLERYAKLQYNNSFREKFSREQRHHFLDDAKLKYTEVYKGQVSIDAGEHRIARAAYNLANCHRLSDNMIFFRVADALYQKAFPAARHHRIDSILPYNIQLQHGILCGHLMRYKLAEKLLLDAIQGFVRIHEDHAAIHRGSREPERISNAKECLADIYWSWRRYGESEKIYRRLALSGAREDENWLSEKLGQRKQGVVEWVALLVTFRIAWIVFGLFYSSQMP